MRRAALVLASLSLGGCLKLVDPCAGVSGTCLAVQVDAVSSVGRVDGFAVHVAGGSIDVHTDSSAPHGATSLPVAFAVVLGALPTSPLAVTVDVSAQLQGATVAQGGAGATLTNGQHVTVHVRLAANGASGGADLAVGDALSSDTDLAPPADLTGVSPLADLSSPNDMVCTPATATIGQLGADVLIVQSYAGSAQDNLNGSSAPTIWQGSSQAISAVVEPIKQPTQWGLWLYPSDGSCGVKGTPDVAVGTGSGAAIQTVLTQHTAPAGGTAIMAAIQAAANYFAGLADHRSHYIVLATAADAACGTDITQPNDDTAAVQAVSAAKNAGIPTYVLALGTTVPTTFTTQLASSGGTGTPFNITNTQAYQTALQSVANAVSACTFGPITAPTGEVTVAAGGTMIPHDPTHANGWDYGPNKLSILLYGSACSGSIVSLSLTYSCP